MYLPQMAPSLEEKKSPNPLVHNGAALIFSINMFHFDILQRSKKNNNTIASRLLSSK